MEQRSAEQVTRIICEPDVISYFGGEESDEEIDAVEEVEIDEENERKIQEPKTIESKEKHKWCLTASSHTPLDFWSALFTQKILDIILKYTNAEIERYVADKANMDSASFQAVTLNELNAFIGLLYFCGVQNNNRANLSEIWSRNFGSTFCKVTMSQRRFEFISSRLRFDDKITRGTRRAKDVLAPIREIWEIFITNCQKNYNPSQSLIINEQLLGFRGNFSARVCIKSKPARYGRKIFSMNDAKTFYMYNAIPYIGKVTTEQDESELSYYLRKLSEPIHNTNRNITCNNWFISDEMCNRMKNEFNLTIIGTLRKYERQISESSGKACEESGKPEMIEFYNKNKRATNVFDQLCENYSCARTSSRWSMRFFLGMLDQASVNSCILYNFLPENENKNKKEFLKDVAFSLIKPHLQERAAKPGLHKSLAYNIKEILSSEEICNPTVGSDKLEKRKRCYFCAVNKDRKTQYCCVKCKKPVCEEHRVVCCVHCIE